MNSLLNNGNSPFDGVVWWSFYDQGFDDLINHLYDYCVPAVIRNRQKRIDKINEVVNVLTNNQFLLVLDGCERILRGYAKITSIYQQEDFTIQQFANEDEAYDVVQRTPINPKAEKFLKAMSGGHSKTLITSRLFPSTLEDLSGVCHFKLKGLSKEDAIAFFRSEGINGSRDDIIDAGKVYDFHPLMLKLLSTSIKRTLKKELTTVVSKTFLNSLINKNEPQKILWTSFQLLSGEEKNIACNLSVLRSGFRFDAAYALVIGLEENRLEKVMIELYNLGFLLYNETQKLFDFHPILRSFLYDQLTSKESIHQLAISYFSKFPLKEKVVNLADIEPTIELYHHLVRAGKFKEAFILYDEKFSYALFYQLGEYQLCIDLCKELFKKDSDDLPSIDDKDMQSNILNELSLCYSYIGQLDKAIHSLLTKMNINYEEGADKNLGMGLKNISEFAHKPLGNFCLSLLQLTKSTALLQENDPLNHHVALNAMGMILTLQGRYSSENKLFSGERYLSDVIAYSNENKKYGLASRASLSLTRWALSQVSDRKTFEKFATKAVHWAFQSMKYAEMLRNDEMPFVVFYLTAYEAISRVLLTIIRYDPLMSIEESKIYFYDEYFQTIRQTLSVNPDNYLEIASKCIHEGLIISRKANDVYSECTFSLLLAQVQWENVRIQGIETERLKEIEILIQGVICQASRIRFRTLLADIHIFSAGLLIEFNKYFFANTSFVGFSAAEHIAEARQNIYDNSTLKEGFLPADADVFYNENIYYDILRDSANFDKVKNGYYSAWLLLNEMQAKIE